MHGRLRGVGHEKGNPVSEFKTSREAENMVRSLHKAARYCTGENSARRHGERVREVETEVQRLRQQEGGADAEKNR